MNGPQRLLVALSAATLVAVAGGLFVAAFRPARPRRRRAHRRLGLSMGTAALAVTAGLVVLVLTRWPVAALAAGAVAVVWSSLFQSAGATRERRRLAAIAKWLEDLRDLQRGSNLDLHQALDRSAVRAPKDIEPELGRFVERIRHHVPFDTALVGLAADLDHPTSDMAVAAMLFAHGHASGSVLYATFEELAASARDEVTARDQIDRIRTRFESSMRRMLVILVALVGYLLVASGDTLDAYRSPVGQLYLVVPIGIWAVALGWLRSLARYRRLGRYLDYDAVGDSIGPAR